MNVRNAAVRLLLGMCTWAWGLASPAAGQEPAFNPTNAVEALDKISLTNLRVEFPKGSIKVLGTELVDGEFLFRIQVRASSGGATIYADREQKTELLSGRMRRFEIDGHLTIPGTSAEPKLRARSGRLTLELNAASATMPTGLGGTLDVRSRFIELVNTSDVTIGASGSRGALRIRLTDTALSQVSLVFDDASNALTLAARLSMPGQSEWITDLAVGRVEWSDGRIVGKDIALAYERDQTIQVGGLRTEFRRLAIRAVEIVKRRESQAVDTTVSDMTVTAGMLKLDGGVVIEGMLSEPLKLSGRWSGEITKDGQIGQSSYDLTAFATKLSVGRLADKSGNEFTDTLLAVDLRRVTPKELAGGLRLEGGKARIAGATNGTADVSMLQLDVEGPVDALLGKGALSLKRFRISTEVHTKVLERCSSTMPIRLNDMEGESVQGAVELLRGKMAFDVRMDEFRGSVGLGFYRCEYDQKVGDLGRWEIVWDSWCPTWSEPFRTCRQSTVIWDGGPIMVHWLVEKQPTIVDTDIAVQDLRVRSHPDEEGGKMRLCGGRVKWLSPNVEWFSWTPNVNATGTVLDMFRDGIRLLGYAVQSGVSTFLGIGAATIGSSRVVVFQC